jgi:two-component system cell cycle response regulator
MGKLVLIAEDQPDSRQLMEDIMTTFQPYGVRVFSAQDGIEAYEIALREVPDLILLDIMMPGMDGYQICEKVKANPETAHTYIIMVSAKTQAEDRRRAAQAGADEYVTKPFDIVHVLDRVGAALNVKPA